MSGGGSDALATRAKVVEELIHSEALYTRQLSSLIKHVVAPAKHLPGVTEHDLREAFGNIEQIAAYHTQLSEQLRQASEVDPTSPSAAQVKLHAVLFYFSRIHERPDSQICSLYKSYIAYLGPQSFAMGASLNQVRVALHCSAMCC